MDPNEVEREAKRPRVRHLTMEKLTIRVIRDSLNFPYYGFCPVDPDGYPHTQHVTNDLESCWRLLEAQLNGRRDGLKAEGWNVVAVDLPDATHR